MAEKMLVEGTIFPWEEKKVAFTKECSVHRMAWGAEVRLESVNVRWTLIKVEYDLLDSFILRFYQKKGEVL